MNRLFRHITKSLAGKLIIAIGMLIIIGGGISWYTLINNGKKIILIDKEQVKQAFGNLITNAIDAMPDGGTLTVTAGIEKITVK
jgi:signal transduction histidine kinase